MNLLLNQTHHFGKQFEDINEELIAVCPLFNGESIATVLADQRVPAPIKNVVLGLPYCDDRKYTWLYVRPQFCVVGQPDKRSGSFWHMDVDAVFRSVAPSWDEFRAMAVAFGNIAETEFADEEYVIPVDGPPKSADYVTYAAALNRQWKSHSPNNGQVVHYQTTDVHRAGTIRRTGWRLIILAFQTNAKPQEKWP